MKAGGCTVSASHRSCAGNGLAGLTSDLAAQEVHFQLLISAVPLFPKDATCGGTNSQANSKINGLMIN